MPVELSDEQHRYTLLWSIHNHIHLSSHARGAIISEMEEIKSNYLEEDWQVFEEFLPSAVELVRTKDPLAQRKLRRQFQQLALAAT